MCRAAHLFCPEVEPRPSQGPFGRNKGRGVGYSIELTSRLFVDVHIDNGEMILSDEYHALAREPSEGAVSSGAQDDNLM